MKVKGRCLICNRPTTNHHYYCDEHYPENKKLVKLPKTKLITMLRKIRGERDRARKENSALKKQVSQLKENLEGIK